MKHVLLVTALLGLAACDADVSVKHDATKEKVAIAGDGQGQVKFDLPFASGNIKLPAGMMSDANFDIDGVKMYPGATVTGFNLNAEDGKSLVEIGFDAPAEPAAVRGYFLDQFKAKGIEAAQAGEGINGTSKDGDKFAMRFAPNGGGTRGTVTIDGRPKN